MGMLINKIAEYGVRKTLKRMFKNHFILLKLLWAGGIIGPYVFWDEAGNNVTVNGVPYRDMIQNFFISRLEEMNIAYMFFQRDGATCHTPRDTINLLRQTFADKIISRNGPQNWPPRSCDLTPLDYFLWGYVK